MDTTHEAMLIKDAGALSSLAKILGVNAVKSYIPLAILTGSTVGASLGYGASMLKAKNPDIIELERKKKFYDAKIREMENENWLNDIISAKRRLETERLSDAERKELESKYISLLDK